MKTKFIRVQGGRNSLPVLINIEQVSTIEMDAQDPAVLLVHDVSGCTRVRANFEDISAFVEAELLPPAVQVVDLTTPSPTQSPHE